MSTIKGIVEKNLDENYSELDSDTLIATRRVLYEEARNLSRNERGEIDKEIDVISAELRTRTAALMTLQFSWGGLFDGRPADNYHVHLIRSTPDHGTPGPTLCGIDRFAENAPGWSVGGGLTGPDVVHVPCDGCADVALAQYAELPIAGSVGRAAMAEYLKGPEQ